MCKTSRSSRLVVLVAAMVAVSASAAAKPSPSGSGARGGRVRATRVHSHVHQERSLAAFTRHALALSIIADAPLYPEMASFGAAAEYQLGLTSRLSLTAGAELRFHAVYMFTEPQIGLDAAVGRLADLEFHVGGGFALPMRIAQDHTDVALAARGMAGVRWYWSLTSRVQPQLQATFLLGPILTPYGDGPPVYAALQILAGVRFAI